MRRSVAAAPVSVSTWPIGSVAAWVTCTPMVEMSSDRRAECNDLERVGTVPAAVRQERVTLYAPQATVCYAPAVLTGYIP